MVTLKQSSIHAGLALMLILFYMPWNQCFKPDIEPQTGYIRFASYALITHPPAPEIPNHPAYSVTPAYDRLFYEWIIVFVFLQLVTRFIHRAPKDTH